MRLAELIGRVPPDVEKEVRKARDRWRQLIQSALIQECRLVMRPQDGADDDHAVAQVPVEIMPGYPKVLASLDFPDDLDRQLVLSRYRRLIEQSQQYSGDLRKIATPDFEIVSGEFHELGAALDSTHRWAVATLDELSQRDPLKLLFDFDEDILGVYKYRIKGIADDDRATNKASIELYWAVIGFVAERLPCGVEELTVVVLTHELAHAYTQLGADIQGRRWRARRFSNASTAVKEGLAQYYTDKVLNRLRNRLPGALLAFQKLLPSQPPVYRAHLPWLTCDGESIRRALLAVRQVQEASIDELEGQLFQVSK